MKLFLTLIIAILQVEAATTIYVDPNGDDTDGSSWAHAKRSPKSVNCDADGIGYISGGTTVQVYTNMQDWTPVGSATAANPFTWIVSSEAGHNGVAWMDSGTNSFLLKGFTGVNFSGSPGLTNLVLSNSVNLAIYADTSSSGHFTNVQVYGSSRFLGVTNLFFSHCNFKGFNNSDYTLQFNGTKLASDPESYTGNVFADCVIDSARMDDGSGFGADGVSGMGSNTSFLRCLITAHFYPDYIWGQHMDGVQAGEGARYVWIEGCILENISNYFLFWEFYGGVDFDHFVCINNIFRCNASTTNALAGSSGIVLGPQLVSGHNYSDILIANNTFIDLYGGGAINCGQQTRSNNWSRTYFLNNLMVNCGNTGGGRNAFSFDAADGSNPVTGSTNGVTIACNFAVAGANGNTSITPGQLATATGSTVTLTSYTPLSTSNDARPTVAPVGLNLTALSLGFGDIGSDFDSITRTNWNVGAFDVPGASSPLVTVPVLVSGAVRFSGAVNLSTQ